MVYDVELVAGAFGPEEGFSITINKADGTPDDLTAYTAVRLVISDMQYTSPPVRNHLASSGNFSVDALGHALYTPTSANPVPPFGKYYIQIFRETTGSVNIPTQKYSLLVTKGVPIS